MGYEVLDSQGSAAGRTPSGVGDLPSPPTSDASQVVDLGDLAPQHIRAHRAPASLAPAGRRGTRLAPAAVALALVVGAVLGGLVTRRQGALAEQRQRESTVAVAALATGITPFPLPIGVGAELAVTVQNLGPAPVDVVTTRSRESTAVQRARVSMPGDDTSVAPGASARVEIRVPVDCRPRRVLTARLPVRTADGIEHSVPVSLPDAGQPPDGLCPRVAEDSAVQATLTGSVVLPTLQLANLTNRTLQVGLPRQGLAPFVANSVVAVVPRPPMPVTLPPRGQVTVGLRFVARSCVEELQDLQRLDIAGLALQVSVLTPGGPMQAGQVSVDVTAVVAAAMVRTCG